jgi:glycosyltransferase involved in cell wall biosynthesis
MNSEIKISVVIPVYNSEQSLNELLQRINNTLKPLFTYEVILVDDGSTDNSWKKIIELKSTYKSTLKGIRLKKNFGQHNSLMCGFSVSKGDFVITMDDDLQHPPEEIIKLINQQKTSNTDLVYGIPLNRKHNSAKKAGSFFIRKSSKYFANTPHGDGSSFRLISRNLINNIVHNYANNYVFIDEIIHWYTSSITFVDVEHHERKFGKSGYSFFKLTKLFLDIFINYTANPLKLMIYGGLLSSFVSFILAIKFIFKKIYIGAPLGYTSIIVSILFSTSIIMLCLGIIGKYIFNLYQQQSGKPLYSIKQII